MMPLSSWLSAEVTRALGWALIHSLWQGLALAALAAVLMAFCRRPSIRYSVATVALVAMLAAPVATFFLLMKPSPPSHGLNPAGSAPTHFVLPSTVSLVPMPATMGAAVAPMRRAEAAPVATRTQRVSPRFRLPGFFPPGILSWLVKAWLGGVALFSLRLAGSFLLLEYKRPGQFSIPSPPILALCRELQRQLGLGRAIRFLECSWLQAPAVIGWIYPVILLPVSALTGLNETQLRAVIAHELAHIRRLDPFVNLLQILVETLLFYHPAIWWLNSRIRAERELCCDEVAVTLTGNRIEYAKALALMAEWDRAPALAMAANRGPLSKRIFHILGQKPRGGGRRALGLVGSILFFVTAMGGANALFGIADPIPIARAKTNFKTTLASNQIALDHIVRPALQAQLAAKKPDQSESVISHKSIDRTQAAVHSQADKLVTARRPRTLAVPVADLAGLLPSETLITPVALVSNDPTSATTARTAARAKAPNCALPTIANSVDLKDVPGSDLKTVPVFINGEAKRFLLDIGTSPAQVSREAAADLGLPDAATPLGSGQGLYMDINYSRVPVVNVEGSAASYRSYARAATFTVGGASGHNLAFLVAKDPDMGKSKPYDGLLTGDLFRQYDVELDFIRNKLNYLTPTNCADPNQVAYWPHAAVAAIPMTALDGKIQVEVSIEGHAIPAVIDTSSPQTVMRRDVAELVLGFKADTPDMMPDGDARDGTGLQVYRHTFAQISFAGGAAAYNVPALIQANSMLRDPNRRPILGSRAQFAADPRQRIPSLTLGMDVLRQLHLYVVHGQRTLYVTSTQ